MTFSCSHATAGCGVARALSAAAAACFAKPGLSGWKGVWPAWRCALAARLLSMGCSVPSALACCTADGPASSSTSWSGLREARTRRSDRRSDKLHHTRYAVAARACSGRTVIRHSLQYYSGAPAASSAGAASASCRAASPNTDKVQARILLDAHQCRSRHQRRHGVIVHLEVGSAPQVRCEHKVSDDNIVQITLSHT